MSVKDEILKFANKFDSEANTVKKEKETYKGLEVYSCYVTENGEPATRAIGVPYFILYDPKSQRMEYVSGEEALEILNLI